MFVAISSDRTCSDPHVFSVYSRKILMNNLNKNECLLLWLFHMLMQMFLFHLGMLWIWEKHVTVCTPLTFETQENSVETRKSTGGNRIEFASELLHSPSVFSATSAVFPFTQFYFLMSSFKYTLLAFHWSVTNLKSWYVQWPTGLSCPQGSNSNEWLSWQSPASKEGFFCINSDTSPHSQRQVNKLSRDWGVEKGGTFPTCQLWVVLLIKWE